MSQDENRYRSECRKRTELVNCPTCGGETHELLVDKSIGDSVNETFLFHGESSVSSVLKWAGIYEYVPERFRDLTKNYSMSAYGEPIINHLQNDEHPHFITEGYGLTKDEGEGEIEIDPSEDYLAAAVVTDKRVLFVVGREDGNLTYSCEYSDIVSAGSDTNILLARFHVNTEDASYTLRRCDRKREQKAAAEYILSRADASRKEEAEYSKYKEWYKEKYGSQNSIFEGIDKKEVAEGAATGISYGRGNPRRTIIAMLLGAGFGAWSSLEDEDIDGSSPPSPEDVAREVQRWREAGQRTGNKKAEWGSAAVGAGISFASENSDSDVVDTLTNIEPEEAVSLVQESMWDERLSGSDSSLLPISSESTENLPDIQRIREPVGETASIIEELFDEGLYKELVENHRD